MRVAYAILGTAMLLLAWPFMLILAARLGVAPATISGYRRHGLPCYEPVGGVFSGLMR